MVGVWPSALPSHAWRRPPGHEHADQTQHDQHQGNGAPPVLPEGGQAMGALTPGPEDTEEEENGADNLANPTHSPKTSPLNRGPRRERGSAAWLPEGPREARVTGSGSGRRR